MSTVPIEVIHNHLAEPGEHRSLLLVRYGTLTIEVTRCNGRYSVYASRSRDGHCGWTERAIDAATLEEAAAKARRLVRELEP